MFRLCGDRDKTVIRIIIENLYPRLGGKVDQLGIVQEIKFDDYIKWYMHKPESV